MLLQLYPKKRGNLGRGSARPEPDIQCYVMLRFLTLDIRYTKPLIIKENIAPMTTQKTDVNTRRLKLRLVSPLSYILTYKHGQPLPVYVGP